MQQQIHEWKAGEAVTDQDIEARIHRALRSAGDRRLHSVNVEVRDGHVVLRGCVPSYYFKQMVQTIAMSTGRPASLRNDTEVA